MNELYLVCVKRSNNLCKLVGLTQQSLPAECFKSSEVAFLFLVLAKWR